METIKKFLKFVWKNSTFILIGVVAILVFLNLKQCSGDSYQNKLHKQNVDALNEKMRTIEGKNGELIRDKSIYFADLKDIKENNKELYAYFEEFKANGYKPEIVTITKYVFVDSGRVANKLNHVQGDKYSLDFEYQDSDSIIKIVGKSNFFASSYVKQVFPDGKYDLGINFKPDSTTFDKITFRSGLALAMGKDKDGIDRIIAKPHPYTNKIVIEDIQVAGLEEYYKKKYGNKKIKRFSAGPSIGYGITTGGGGVIGHGAYIGIGVQYSLIRF